MGDGSKSRLKRIKDAKNKIYLKGGLKSSHPLKSGKRKILVRNRIKRHSMEPSRELQPQEFEMSDGYNIVSLCKRLKCRGKFEYYVVRAAK